MPLNPNPPINDIQPGSESNNQPTNSNNNLQNVAQPNTSALNNNIRDNTNIPANETLVQPSINLNSQITNTQQVSGNNSLSARNKTFAAMHQHESPISIILIIITIIGVIFNILFSLRVEHIRSIDYTNYKKQQAKIYNSLPSTIAQRDRKSFGPFVLNRPSGTLDLSHLVNGSYSVMNQQISANLKQQVNLADGESLMINSVQTNWKPINPNDLSAASGDYFILLNMVIGNRNLTTNELGDFAQASAIVNNQKLLNINVYPFASDFSNSNLEQCSNIAFNQFNPGQQVNCVMVIQVPINTLPTVEFNSLTTSSVNGASVSMEASIKL